MKNSLGLDYLKAAVRTRRDDGSGGSIFAEVHGTTLGAEYWGWVKNQAIEKEFKISRVRWERSNATSSANAVIGSVSELEYPPEVASEGPPASAKSKGDLSGLTAKVVRIKVMDDVGPTTITALKPPAGLAYKVYLDVETGCADLDPDEQERTFPSLAKDFTLYVVLANVEHQVGSRIAYDLEVKPAPPPSP